MEDPTFLYPVCMYFGEPTTVFAKDYELGSQVCEKRNYIQIEIFSALVEGARVRNSAIRS